MREKINGLTKERRQIISPLLAGFSIFIYFYWVAGLRSSLPCWRCLILTSSHHEAGNRVGRCCVYGFVTAGFMKMKLPVQTAAPLTAPVKSQGMPHCLDVNHFLQRHGGETDTRVTFVSLSGLLPNDPRPGGQHVMHLLAAVQLLLLGGQNTEISKGIYCQLPEFQQGIRLLL